MKTALLFAGQATQYVGMGQGLRADYPEARAVFEAADDALGESLSSIIFDGPETTLNLTSYTQPAVLTVACAAWAVLKNRGLAPAVVAGHSLGEYGALVATGALSFFDAVRLCRRRGEYMQSAVPPGEGAMAAIQRLDEGRVEEACARNDGLCVPAVYNAPKLVVISGVGSAVHSVSSQLEAEGALVTHLAVSAPFHSPLLEPAAAALAKDLEAVEFGPLHCPYVSNVDAEWIDESSPQAIRDRLVRQVTGVVRWSQSIALMFEHGVERFWHLGPGRANLTHVKRQHRRTPTASMDTPADIAKILKELERT